MAATHTLIGTTTVTSATGTIVFSSISSSFTDLYFEGFVNPANDAGGADVYMHFNSENTGTNYSLIQGYGFATTFDNTTSSGRANFPVIGFGNSTQQSANMQTLRINIPEYASTSATKVCFWDFGYIVTYDSTYNVGFAGGRYNSTSAISSVTFTATSRFVVGSTISLYGILAGTA